MNESEERQQSLHDAIQGFVEGGPLVGWIVCFEYLTENEARCGHFYGPAGMTSWRALGLVEWAGRHTLLPGEEDD